MVNEKAKTSFFSDKLIQWYRRYRRKLPWRETQDPYKIWISEIMLQQTTVPAVIPYYNQWMKTFPDVTALSRAPRQKILKVWQGLGYYQRAKNIHRAAVFIMTNHQGKVPDDYNTLIQLPGFGPYTTAAVLSIAHNLPYPVIDANVRRVLMRLNKIHKPSLPKVDTSLKTFIQPFLPLKKMGVFNQALMELGALICRPRNPLCLQCPLINLCKAYAAGEQEIIPVPKKCDHKKIEAVLAIIKKDNRYLIQKRPPHGLLADLWEFPGGKRQTGETLREALQREISEELGVSLKDLHFLTTVNHAYTNFLVTLHAFACQPEKEIRLVRGKHKWITLKGLRHFPLPSGSVKIIKFLETNPSLL